MSYGNYQSGQTPGVPYPQQSYPPPPGGAPYPKQGYPPVNPNTFGFNSHAPMSMPQPMSIPVYAPSAPPSSVSHNVPYPTPSGPYPNPPSAYGAPTQYPPAPSYPSYPPNPTYPTASGAPPTGYPAKGPYGGFSYTTQSVPPNHTGRPKRTPTVVPANPFDPRSDAEILRKAMKGFGTDEKAIINVLAYRSNEQRLRIAYEFKTLYGKNLIKDLKSETSGNFENVLVALMTPLPEYYAKELHNAIAGLGTDENVLIEVLCTKSNDEIMVIRQAYQALYSKDLEEDLIGDTSGTFKRLMVSLCNACRDESMMVNPETARADAQALLRAGELRLGTDESTFNMVLCQRNWAQLQLIFQEYHNLTGHDIEQAIKNEFSGSAEDGLLAIIRSIKNQAAFFAKCLNKSMKGLGTNDNDLIRLVVTRSEIDMVEIKREYQAKYGESLADAIKGDCSGHYKKCLLHLIGEP
ncbi:hypothetical protein GWI33_005680 [Rhynchophorus ferrugineus]|uniref:Annexin n=1 Tax=Rhynchophorus ferrugineus TaxID=354439 RepID=A0A834IWD2_RHYFE|nr:hypothetical protein GWI33_005680 [Rhynchophorus ferrugineus]